MSHSFTHLVYHLVFATKMRRACLEDALQPELYARLGDLIRQEGGVALAVNGMPEHVHLLARLSPARALSDVLRAVKANTSLWLSKTVPGFAWQTGYSAFTVSRSSEDAVRRYIEDQKRHHATRTYLDEYRSLLEVHGMTMPPEEEM